jgi:tetratricopeptide (TPR) repeat protein
VEANNGQWPDAANDFAAILQKNPQHKNAKERLGEVLFLWGDDLEKSGDHEQAVKHYQESLILRPDDADLHAHLGTALAQLKRYKEAKAEFESVLKIDPNSAEAKQALVAIDARQRLGSQ